MFRPSDHTLLGRVRIRAIIRTFSASDDRVAELPARLLPEDSSRGCGSARIFLLSRQELRHHVAPTLRPRRPLGPVGTT